FELSSSQTFRQPSTVEPVGLHSLSWSSGNHRWSGDQAPITLSHKPIIQPVPRRSSLIDKGNLLIPNVLAHMIQQVIHAIRHVQRPDESLRTAKSCRDTLFVHIQSGKHIIFPGYKRLVFHLVTPVDNGFYLNHCTRALAVRTDIPHTSLNLNVIITTTPQASRAVLQATSTVPIVITGFDPVRIGLAKSLAQPGGNLTGLSSNAGSGMMGKRLELLKEAFPNVKIVGLLTTPT